FRNDTFVIAPANLRYQYNRIDTFLGTTGTVDNIISIDKGGSANLKYSITNGQINGINIDSVTGTIGLDSRIIVGYYPITITATNETGSTNTNIIINIKPNIDSIIGLSNCVFQTTTASTGGNGDYVQLPTLDMSGNYTIETWFKNTGALGSWRRVFDFGSGPNGSGILLGFPTATQIGFHSNSADIITNLPSNFSLNGWNHIVLTFDGTNLRLYLNGVLISTNAATPVAAATCTSNFIARSNWNSDGTTRGQFRDFRIWKKVRTASEILSNINSIVPQPEDSLYYYLPLTYTSTNNPLSTINIPNNTVLTNAAIWQGKLNGSSVITSQNNTGAKYVFNDSAQKIYGYYYRDLLNNEKIQFSIDTGRTWINSDTAIYNRWIATLPSNFRMGIIQVRGAINNTATNRFFTNDTFLIAPDIRYQFNTIDTIEGTIGIIDSVLSIDYRGRFSTLKYRISSGQVNGINIDSMNGTISLDARLFAGFYPITVTATNQIGSTNINLNINVRFVNRNVILSFYNNSLQTTTEGTGGNGDYVQLPALDMSGKYTIETWFKNTEILGGWRRLFDFGSGPNGNGVLFGFPTDTLIGYHSNGADIVINLPANFSTNGWNHIALSFDNTNLRLYLNGVLISTNAAQPIAAATCTSNFIARSNYPNDGTTRGEFQDFRIWKKARTASEIQNGLRTSVLVNSDSLYYYLPLVKPNIAYNSNINNGTNINNASTTTLALRLPSTITSQANIGARYSYDTNRQRLFGTISDTLRSNEKIQFSIDTGLTWTNVDTVIGLNWVATIPANFLWGEIRVRSDSN
ncbi:MAG: LamG domain-containing protein, partial [Sediminibacterium sp.]|nr:LamG domain-containing protein [Sediminibacterium sp.]